MKGRAEVARGDKYGELVTAQPPYESRSRESALQHLAHGLNHAIAGRVSVYIIDILELVRIDLKQIGRLAAVSAVGQQGLGPDAESEAVQKSGQRIVFGQEPGLLFRHAHRPVRMRRDPRHEKRRAHEGDRQDQRAHQQHQTQAGGLNRDVDDQAKRV